MKAVWTAGDARQIHGRRNNVPPSACWCINWSNVSPAAGCADTGISVRILSLIHIYGELICAEVPRLALCLSGTPSQLANFIRSLENGLYCRFGIYTLSLIHIYFRC